VARRYRTKVTLYYEILRSVRDRGTAQPTRIMYDVNLPYSKLKEMLEEMVSKGLLAERREGKSVEYSITEEGLRLLVKLEDVLWSLRRLGLQV